MASHFQTEAWVTREWPIDLITSCGLGNELTQGNKSGPEGAVEIDSRNLKKHSILDFGILHCTWKFERRL